MGLLMRNSILIIFCLAIVLTGCESPLFSSGPIPGKCYSANYKRFDEYARLETSLGALQFNTIGKEKNILYGLPDELLFRVYKEISCPKGLKTHPLYKEQYKDIGILEELHSYGVK